MAEMGLQLLLSGGIGSGKSTVAALLRGRGADVIDADAEGHAVLDPAGDAYAAVADRWPQVVVSGRIDRAALGRAVFGDPAQLEELEAITHPAIAARLAARVGASAADVVVVELPLLIDLLGEGWPRVVVDAPDEVRRARLAERGLADADITARMAAQPSRDVWLAAADFVVDNSGSLAGLDGEVDRLWRWISAGAPTGDGLSGPPDNLG